MHACTCKIQVGTKHTPFAVLSRPVAGVRGGAFVVTLPGSPKVRMPDQRRPDIA